MLSVEKRAAKFEYNFLSFSAFRKLMFECSPKCDGLVSVINILKTKYSDCQISPYELDWFRYFLNVNMSADISIIRSHSCRVFANLAKKIGLDGTLSKLWIYGNLQLKDDFYRDFLVEWNKKEILLSISGKCPHESFYEDSCESCRIKDSYFEGIINIERRPSLNQRHEKYRLIYLIGRDRYLENSGRMPSL